MVFNMVILPLLIFFSRIIDVSLGTIRIIFVSKGKRVLAPLLGFFEVLIWLIAMQQIMKNVTNIWLYIMYAAGFASGNFIGILIEEKLCIGKIMVRIIPQKDTKKLIETLKEKGFRLTVLDANGAYMKVKIIFSVMSRKKLKSFLEIVNQVNPNAFYTIEDIRYVKEIDSQLPIINSIKSYKKGI